MKKRTKTAMAALCVLCLAPFPAACGGMAAKPGGTGVELSQTPSPPAADSAQENLVIGGKGEWTPLDPGSEEAGEAGMEIETGVYFVQENPGDNPDAYDTAAFAWERMKENGNPAGTTNRTIIFRLTGTEFIGGFEHYVYSVELDTGDGPVPLFRIAAYKPESVLFKAGDIDGNGWEPLGHGDLFGGQKAYF